MTDPQVELADFLIATVILHGLTFQPVSCAKMDSMIKERSAATVSYFGGRHVGQEQHVSTIEKWLDETGIGPAGHGYAF